MSNVRVDIEDLSSDLNGNILLLEGVIGAIESDCIERGWDGSSQAEWFMGKMRNFHMVCLNQILKNLLEIDASIGEEADAVIKHRRSA